MKVTTRTITYLTLTLALIGFTTSTQARIKCWTNKDGVRECGDKVPPEYAQKGHEEISEKGFVVDEQERAKTAEEIEEEKRLAAMKEKEEKKVAEQKLKNKILLDTFSQVEDIEASRESRLAAIESSITLANARNEKMQMKMDHMTNQAATAERSGNEPSADLTKDIDRLQKQIDDNNKFISDKRAEQETINNSFDKDIARFKELKGLE